MNQIRIVSNGTPAGTKVFNHDGAPIDGITSIKLHIGVGTLMTAEMTFTNVQAEIIADWTNHPLKKWADKKSGRIDKHKEKLANDMMAKAGIIADV